MTYDKRAPEEAMTDPAQPASEKWIDVSAHTAALGIASYKLEELARQLALAQTENAGHIRIEDELKSDLAQAQARCAELEKDADEFRRKLSEIENAK